MVELVIPSRNFKNILNNCIDYNISICICTNQYQANKIILKSKNDFVHLVWSLDIQLLAN